MALTTRGDATLPQELARWARKRYCPHTSTGAAKHNLLDVHRATTVSLECQDHASVSILDSPSNVPVAKMSAVSCPVNRHTG